MRGPAASSAGRSAAALALLGVQALAMACCARPSAGEPGAPSAAGRPAPALSVPAAPVASGPAEAATAASGAATAASGAATAAARAVPPDTAAYPWHAGAAPGALGAADHLDERFPPPPGYARVPLEPESFGAWLRRLPLAPPGTPVRAYDGELLRPGDGEHVAAVATLDVSPADLQQCADAVMRLHAEWSWSRGRPEVSYRAASGTPLPFARWAQGERPVLHGSRLDWEPQARASRDYRSFRKYLDAVFGWANTVSLARQAKPVALDELRPGDFFILPGNPGHGVLVLDLARAADGRRAVLLGQSYMPAQSFHVIRPSRAESWFVLDEQAGGVQTPFWPAPFPWTSLRRLD
ncbi:MAG: hypothetical protein HY744_03850 [Deltaproteobacteria bacterium]|nr:hypothetical protein [Deltaproteobacteria bacterium]